MSQSNEKSGAQMLLKLKLSQTRVISHFANIEATILGNVVMARRGSFLARFKVAGDQQLKNYLHTTYHSALFVGKITSVPKKLRSVTDGSQYPITRVHQPLPLKPPSRIMPHGLRLSMPNP